MSVLTQTVLLLIASNVFMTFAWYAHLKNLNGKPWLVAALVSWGIALFEYLLQVPANRIGYSALGLRAVRRLLYEGAAALELPVGRALHVRRGVLHVQEVGRPGFQARQG
jgi:uncharacterized protein (DUF486 family)